MTSFAADARYAIRMLLRSPGFTAVAVATLALAIGVNTAIFSLVDSVLWKPLPYPASERLVSLHEANLERGIPSFSVSPPNYFDWRDRNRSFSALAALDTEDAALTGIPRRPAERIRTTYATAELFPVVAVPPELGRGFTADEAKRGGPHVAVIGHSLREKVFGVERNVLGRTVRLDSVDYVVVGVMPAGFEYPAGYGSVWLPIVFPENVMTQRGAHYLEVVGRLKPGVTVESAERDLAAIHRAIHAENPGIAVGWEPVAASLHEQISGKARPPLRILLGAVLFVLLIACANVANLLLARATGRESELATRAALGAGRGRIIRQLLTESFILSAAGCTLGILLAGWCVSWMVRFGPQDLPRLAETQLDWRVLAFSILLTAATAALFGMAPALRAARGVDAGLKSGGRSRSGSREAVGLRQGFVVAEIALSLILLAGSGLLLRSFGRLQNTDPGFRARRVLTYNVSLPETRYPNDEAIGRFFKTLFERSRALPGVRSVAAIYGLPLAGTRFSSTFTIAGEPPPPPANEPSSQLRVVSRDYFRTIGIPLVAGRGFTSTDRRGAPAVMIASAAAARRFWPAGDAIGHRVRFGARMGATRVEGEIVGIVGDIRDAGLDQEPTPFFYGSLEQAPVGAATVILETAAAPRSLSAAAAGAVTSIDRDVPVSDIQSMGDIVALSIARQRFAALLVTLFAGAALLLAAIGTYGVLAYGVGLRRREIGVRAALGATPRGVLLLILRQGALLSGLGTAIGLAAALGVTRLMSGLLFGVGPRDIAVLASAAAILVGVSLLASGLPAWRAARISPSEALRAE